MKTEITESDVIAWLRATAKQSDIAGLTLSANSGGYHEWVVGVEKQSKAFGCGHTIAEAVEMIRKDIKTPEQLAAEKRETAAKLLAEADALAPVVPQLVEAGA